MEPIAEVKPEPSTAAKPLAHYTLFDAMPIDGMWRAGSAGTRAPDLDPFTGETLVEIPLANARDVDDAYRAAQRVQPAWAQALPQERRAVLERAARIAARRKDEIVDWLIEEAGSTRVKALWEHELFELSLIEAAALPYHVEGRILPSSVRGKESRVYRRPVGVVGVISPWNFPLYMSSRSVAPALALGNSVVVKPASDTPVSGGLLLAKIFDEAGLPPALLQVIVGEGREIGDAFVQHPVPRVLSFTGTTAVGRRIAELAARDVKRVCLELGGNAPFIVLDDADLDRAVDAAVYGKFLHQGQLCTSINRILVDASRYDEFLDRFATQVASLNVGDPADADTVIGPLINRAQLERIEKLVADTVAAGARTVLGGGTDGLILSPVILADVTNDMPAAQEELFGPVAPVIRFHDEDDAVRIANDTDYGLSSAVFTGDLERGARLAQRLDVGMTHVNDSSVNDEINAAFGGEKQSGLGRFGGDWALRELSTDHWISLQHTPRRYPF